MYKKILLISVICLSLYYITTFIVSFTFLSKAVVNNNSALLNNYINSKKLKNNFYNDIYKFTLNKIDLINKDINIKNESMELSGELTLQFIKKTFSRISKTISSDLSNPKIMLYFYFNSVEISAYLNKSFKFFGDYNFDKFIKEKEKIQPSENKEVIKNKEMKNNVTSEEEVIETIKETKEKKNIILNFLQRIKSTDYFFLSSPLHFKIEVTHQDIPFIVILKFNGYKWKLEKITIPYKKLIEKNYLNIIN